MLHLKFMSSGKYIVEWPKLINSFKTALACLIGYALYLWTPLPEAQWILITIVVVMSAQTSIGSLFIKAKMRFWGTVCGTVAAVIIILVCGNHHLALAIALFIIFMIFTYIASTPGDISYVGTLGSVTVAIIILNPYISMTIAGERFVEILLGISISFLVSYLVFPIRSHTMFIKSLISTLNYISEHFEQSFEEPKLEVEETLLDVNEKVLGIFAQQRRLIHETGLELGKSRKDKFIFQRVLNSERRIYRAINLMYYSLHAAPISRNMIQSLSGFDRLKQEVTQFLNQLSNAVKSGSTKEVDFLLTGLIDYIENDFKKIMHTQEYLHVSYAHTFLFGTKFLLKELKVLTETVGEINYLRISKIW